MNTNSILFAICELAQLSTVQISLENTRFDLRTLCYLCVIYPVLSPLLYHPFGKVTIGVICSTLCLARLRLSPNLAVPKSIGNKHCHQTVVPIDS